MEVSISLKSYHHTSEFEGQIQVNDFRTLGCKFNDNNNDKEFI